MGATPILFVKLRDLGGIEHLAAAARLEGFRMVDRLIREWDDGTNRFNSPGEALFGAYAGKRLVGVAGLTRQNETIGRVRRLYIDPDFRRSGLGTALLVQVLGFAERSYSELVLFTDNPISAQFYERHGFLPEDEHSADRASHRLTFVERSEP